MALRVPRSKAYAETPRGSVVITGVDEAGRHLVSTAVGAGGGRAPTAGAGIALDLDWLADYIRGVNQPVSIRQLSRQAVRSLLVTDGRNHAYAPGRRFCVGERIRLSDGRVGDVQEIAQGKNDVQGPFAVVSLQLKGGEMLRLAAEVPGAPDAADPSSVSDATVDRILGQRADEITRVVRQALASDPRFITLYTRDGEYGCLREFFPPMSPDVLDAALSVLLDTFFDQLSLDALRGEHSSRGASDGEATDRPTSDIPALAELLFASDHLDDVAPGEDEPVSDDERRAYLGINALWTRARQLGESWDSSQMARIFVQPLLRALGWSSVPLQSLCGAPSGAYALCAHDGAAAELYTRVAPGADVSSQALAVVQAAAWDEMLDQPATERPDAFPSGPTLSEDTSATVPAHRIVGLLHETGVSWGILTNGRIWRLYAGDADSVVRTFYQVDLDEAFGGGADAGPERWRAFRRWWTLFSRASYELDRQGRSLLDRLRARVPSEEVRVRDLLRERLLGQVLPAIAGGFLAYRRQRGAVTGETPETLRLVHRASALLAMRLLFLLIAEARDLLPNRDPEYHPHSVTVQARWAAGRVDRGLPLGEGVYTTPRYDVVLALFRRLSRGDPEKGLPAYGRLFFDPAEDEAHGFLDRTRLCDAALGLALDGLYRGVPLASLDARDFLAVCSELVGTEILVAPEAGPQRSDQHRQLGEQPGRMAAGEEKTQRAPRPISTAEHGEPAERPRRAASVGAVEPNPSTGIQEGEHGIDDVVVIRKGEARRAPMALPDFVVTTTVEQALAPVLQARGEAFAAAMDEVLALRRRLNRALDRRRRAALYAEWEAAARRARDCLTAIRVCDPAMGAGGFMLGAVDVLTDGIIDQLRAYHAAHPKVRRDWNPVYRWIDDLRGDAAEEIGRQGVTPDPSGLDDAVLLSRLVAQRSLFGVAEEPLGVDVAKAALWLHTFVPGMPLSFFDHHLRAGNGVLGVDLAAVSASTALPRLAQGIVETAGPLYALNDRVDTAALDVRWSSGQFRRLEENLAPYRLLFDLATCAALGDEAAVAMLRSIEGASEWQAQLAALAPMDKLQCAEAGHFLHWDLAFPEVHIDWSRNGWDADAGFDVVLGAPPWLVTAIEPQRAGGEGARSVVSEAAARYLRMRFGDPDGQDEDKDKAEDARQFDIHQVYLSLARRLVSVTGGRTSYVISRAWLTSPMGEL